jgi:holin-like protein
MPAAVTALLVCQLIGELVARALGLPIPGPVIGMLLLFVVLLVRHGGEGLPEGHLEGVADTLLGNLGLLFVPAGVGVMLYLPLLARDGVAIVAAIVGGTVVGIAFTARLANWLLKGHETREETR